MQKIKRYFGEFSMTWPKVLLLAVGYAVYTALINQVPFLNDTSFQDIAVLVDPWFLPAVFIVVNCRKWWDAVLKCFVFFLVSQPLIYLIEVPFVGTFDIFRYYRYWFIVTLLTIPGAAIAYQLKRKNWLSVAVLAVAGGYLCYVSTYYLHKTVQHFPHHLLSAVFCLALAVFFVLVLFDKRSHRLVSIGLIVVFLLFSLFVTFIGIKGKSTDIWLGEGEWSYTVEDDAIVKAELKGEHLILTSLKNGRTRVSVTNQQTGEIEVYEIVIDGSDFSANQIA